VKEPLKAPFIFVLILLCATAALAALQVLAAWGLSDSPNRAFSTAYLLAKLPRAIFDVMIPSVVLSIVLLGFRMARRPFSRLLGLLIVLGVGYVALVNGMIWFRTLAGKSAPATESPRQYLQAGTFTRVGDGIVAVNGITGAAVTGILRIDPARAGGRFAVYAAGAASSRGGTLTITTSTKPPVTISGSADLSWTGVFAPDRFTSVFLRDIGTLTGDFERLLARSLPEFFAACLALVFLCAASLALLRLTRWPLANAMILVIAVRGYFSLYHLLAVRLAPQIAKVISDGLVARLAPSAVFAAIGVLLLLVDILLIPADRWSNPETA
jgi:hypothetical protein